MNDIHVNEVDGILQAVKIYTAEYVINNIYTNTLGKSNWDFSDTQDRIDINNEKALRDFFQKKLNGKESKLSTDEMKKVFLFFTDKDISGIVDKKDYTKDENLKGLGNRILYYAMILGGFIGLSSLVSSIVVLIVLFGAALFSISLDVMVLTLGFGIASLFIGIIGATSEDGDVGFVFVPVAYVGIIWWLALIIRPPINIGPVVLHYVLVAPVVLTLVGLAIIAGVGFVDLAIVRPMKKQSRINDEIEHLFSLLSPEEIKDKIKNRNDEMEMKNDFPDYKDNDDDFKSLCDGIFRHEGIKNLLTRAMNLDDLKMVEKIMSKFRENITTAHELNPLALSARYGSVNVMKFLLDENRPDVVNKSMISVSFNAAIVNKQPQAVELLLAHAYKDPTFDINEKIVNNESFLETAIKQGTTDTVKLLANAGAIINPKYDRLVPLDFAIDTGNKEIIECLIGLGAYTHSSENFLKIQKIDPEIAPCIFSNINKLPTKEEKLALVSELTDKTPMPDDDFKNSYFEKMLDKAQKYAATHAPNGKSR